MITSIEPVDPEAKEAETESDLSAFAEEVDDEKVYPRTYSREGIYFNHN